MRFQNALELASSGMFWALFRQCLGVPFRRIDVALCLHQGLVHCTPVDTGTPCHGYYRLSLQGSLKSLTCTLGAPVSTPWQRPVQAQTSHTHPDDGCDEGPCMCMCGAA